MQTLENYQKDQPENAVKRFFRQTWQAIVGRVRSLEEQLFDPVESGRDAVGGDVPIPPALSKAEKFERLFGGGSSSEGEAKATVFSGGQSYEVDLYRSEAGRIEIRKPPSEFVRRSKPNGVSATAAYGGAGGISQVATRVSQDSDSYGSGLEGFVVFARNSYWKKFAMSDSISLADLRNVPIDKIGELCATISPEISEGLHIRTVFSNSGFEIEALKLDKDETDERAQKLLTTFRRKTARQNGTEDVFFNRLFSTYFMRGSILAELVLEENARDFAAIVTPDPKTLNFRRIAHESIGTVWDFYQLQNGKPVSLNVETVRYVPLNPFTDSIEGNSLLPSSFFIAIFLMAVLRDFKRVIQQQGYPRYDIELDLEALKNLMPSEAEDDTPEGSKAFENWAMALRDSVKGYIEKLKPDDTFIHYSGVKVNQPVGAMGTNSLSSIDGLFKALERMAARALKVPPLFLGITDGVSEANANRQFEAFIKDIEVGQHAIENAIGDLYALALEAQGIAARVRIRFAQMRSSERLRDAQADLTEAQLAAFQYEKGWISQDQAAKRGAKVDKADKEQPRAIAADAAAALVPPALDSGVNRALRVPTLGELQRAKEIFEEFAPPEADGLIFAEGGDN